MRTFIILVVLSLYSQTAHAATISPPTDLKSFLGILSGIIDILIPFIFALTFITISWGVIRAWIMGESSTDDIDKGKKVAFVGVIALVLMVSIWGILKLLQGGIFG